MNELEDINVALPAKVVSYDAATVRVVAKPAIPKRLASGEVLGTPQIVNVPVMFPMADIGGAVAQITLPVKPGDGCFLIFSQRSLENWLSGSSDAPDDPRMFDLSDAFCFIGGNAKSPSADGENLCIKYGSGSIKIAPSGDITIDAPSTTINAPTNTINGDVQINGAVSTSSTITAQGDIVGNGISLGGHTHMEQGDGKPTSVAQ
ncbi:Gp138 family membrane-puncturing spike protein [Rodentibacter ratti]|uniref:Phage baseplate protein n=1 Tax=Rodentibacter ratti TaxID=1906745 RepID=A0A1V3L5R5_9PAST|nr:Gp138 family membrane-puncturing spike protein [Rodentibacter ratti]OOF85141.1 phage baseplate protein [Rodentibacter ratti]